VQVSTLLLQYLGSSNIFSISVYFIDEVKLNVFLLDVCGIMFGGPYMYMRDAICMWRANQYRLVNDRKVFIINAHKGKLKISHVPTKPID